MPIADMLCRAIPDPAPAARAFPSRLVLASPSRLIVSEPLRPDDHRPVSNPVFEVGEGSATTRNQADSLPYLYNRWTAAAKTRAGFSMVTWLIWAAATPAARSAGRNRSVSALKPLIFPPSFSP